jgi:hypothetical protein
VVDVGPEEEGERGSKARREESQEPEKMDSGYICKDDCQTGSMKRAERKKVRRTGFGRVDERLDGVLVLAENSRGLGLNIPPADYPNDQKRRTRQP